MATLTTSISNVSLTVSGNTTKTATISWTCPTVPAGSTIISCKLTGTASSFTTGNKGATLTINNTSVSSGSSFTINLGTGNNTTSVQASFKGNHKQSNTSVTLSNLVYTVEYTEPVVTYTVTFKDWDGSVLKTEEVESGSAATAPSNPSREGYEFIGWDKTFSNITSDLTVTAQYRKVYVVTFKDWDGTVLKTQTVYEGESATAPESPNREGYEFIGWDIDFDNIVADLTVIAQYKKLDALQIKENGDWIDIGKVYKRVSGNWVEQPSSNLNTIFDSNMKYNIAKPNPVAIYYSDGTVIFQDSDIIDSSHGEVIGTNKTWATTLYNPNFPWVNSESNVSNVILNTIVSPKHTEYWFNGCSNLTLIDLSNFDTSNVTSMTGMFKDCSSLISIDLSSLDTNNVTTIDSMFRNCSNLTSINLKGLNTSNVTDISLMFFGCSSLTSIDLSSLDISNVTDATNMFRDCSNLTSINLKGFNNSSGVKISFMFSGCSSLTSIDLSGLDVSKINAIYNMSNVFQGCTSLQTIYVKDETAKTKIEASTGFPTGVSVIIGKPN